MAFHEDDSITPLFGHDAGRGLVVVGISEGASCTANTMSDAEDDAPCAPAVPDVVSIPETMPDTQQLLACDYAEQGTQDKQRGEDSNYWCGWFDDTAPSDISEDSQLTVNQDDEGMPLAAPMAASHQDYYKQGMPLAAPMAASMVSGKKGKHDTGGCIDERGKKRKHDTGGCIDEDMKEGPEFIASVRNVLWHIRDDAWLLC